MCLSVASPTSHIKEDRGCVMGGVWGRILPNERPFKLRDLFFTVKFYFTKFGALIFSVES